MISIRIADLNVCIDNKYDYLQRMCRGYLSDGAPELTVSVTEEEIDKEGVTKDRGYAEALAVYRKISEVLPYRSAFLMHGAVVDVSGTGVAFLAVSGTGKTTHMLNWRSLLGDELKIVNGDKPLIRVTDGEVFAYGTPWCGKERLHTNMKTPLKKICFIERDSKNSCVHLSEDPLRRLLAHIYRPADAEAYFKTLDLIGKVIDRAEFYLIRCTPEPLSACIAIDTVIRDSTD